MENIQELIDVKDSSSSYCQSKTVEDDGIISRNKCAPIEGRPRNGVKSMSRSFSEGSFQDTGQVKRRFSYNSPFGLEQRSRYMYT